ncbi:ferritin-like domain-containing protein [Kitasatospora phosalacinea]|uniref:Ferritin-like domain-containing protein n=1 Tax=Kitasatospora phosalacinea TaxID=2065 RepID=A0ABW6GNV1_9ACTN
MPAPTRRTFLALGALTGLLLLPGCTDDHPAKTPQPQAEDPDRPLRLRQLAATDALLARYDAALAAAGTDPGTLGDLRADVVRHREEFARTLPAPAASPSASASATVSASATASAAASAAAAPTAADLAAAEQRTAALRLADLAAASPELARTLASVAASGAAHAAALGDTTAPAAPAPSPDPSASTAASSSASASAPAVPAADTGALQAALAAEHAAVYGYGVVGAFLPAGPRREDARTTYAAHQARRDAWQRLLAAGGASPTAAAAGYRLPFPVKDAATATQLAAHLETQLTAAYADLAAAPAYRDQAAAALRECALRAAHWGADLPALPGLAAEQ